MTDDAFWQRMGYIGNLNDISLQVCMEYDLGEIIACAIVEQGSNNCNFILETVKGKYFVKMFSKDKTVEECRRYIAVTDAAVLVGVSTPKILDSKQGKYCTVTSGDVVLRLCVLEYIDGDTFSFLGQTPSADEITFITGQAALINSIEYKPSSLYDSRVIGNFEREWNERGKYLAADDFDLIQPLLSEVRTIPFSELPLSFVHGNITTANVMKDKRGKLWIIDFSAATFCPRVQELAILGCGLAFGAENFELTLNEYQRTTPMTINELSVLPQYILLAHAMTLLFANFELIMRGNNSTENMQLFDNARLGLKLGKSQECL